MLSLGTAGKPTAVGSSGGNVVDGLPLRDRTLGTKTKSHDAPGLAAPTTKFGRLNEGLHGDTIDDALFSKKLQNTQEMERLVLMRTATSGRTASLDAMQSLCFERGIM